MRRGVVKGDRVGVVVVAEELAVDCQFLFVRAEDIRQLADGKAVTGSHLPQPTLQAGLLMVDQGDAIVGERTIVDEVDHFESKVKSI